MNNNNPQSYLQGFIPYGLGAFLVGIVGGFSTVLGPAFVQDMGLPYNNTTWTALAMATSTAACAPILGKLGDVIGKRYTLFLGIIIFTLGNVLSALATSLLFMLIARFVVGIGSAAIAPVVMAYIVTEFPKDAIAKGFSLYMLISSSAVIFGPTIGGLIIAAYGWRIMLWICSAISIIIFVVCFFTHKKTRTTLHKLTDFDSMGAVLVVIFFSLLLCIPSFGQNFGWSSPQFLMVLVTSFIFLCGLFIIEKRAVRPILPGSFMKRKAFIITVIALFLTQGLMQANMTNIIIFVNYTQPANSTISGYAISIMYIGMSLGAVIIGPLADKFEPKHVLAFSFALTALGCGIMLTFSPAASVFTLASSLGILGFGLGGNGTIFMKVVLSGVSEKDAGAGTGTYGLFRDLSAPFGVAVFVPMFTNSITKQISLGINPVTSAISSIKTLAIVEIICVAAGIAVVLMLPAIKNRRS